MAPDTKGRPLMPGQAAVIARSEATKQSILPLLGDMDCFASLAMTASGAVKYAAHPFRFFAFTAIAAAAVRFSTPSLE